ncbi:DUF1499 domain-containing protein [Roseicyclus sp. F158]|uniref:DUF1499 domain-containing protein n=1 Tax=Tropicimonas omnivorans TaxID=3075590 RepID=A0ABU3DJ24_9RHOB|nr:DUF1499 domain-containing protein [Roseicyclus sp. F158]MDT0683725.1 DUF1499 domain-containing protein [Roseicyclus sp. F158]
MSLLRPISTAFAVFATFGFAWIRLAPSCEKDWHVDPKDAVAASGRYVVGSQGHVPPLRLSGTPTEILTDLDRIAMSSPDTERLAGSPDEGRITYISRSKVFGFPDYTTVAAESGGDGTLLYVFARLRFGRDDMGVNRRRVRAWLAELQRD